MKQRSPEWFQARCGKVTASRFADVMATGRGGAPSKTRESYMIQVIAERLTGLPCDTWDGNKATAHGEDQEFDSTVAVAAHLGFTLEEAEFVQHPKLEDVGASPDAFVSFQAIAKAPVMVWYQGARIKLPSGRYGVEMKCPFKSHVHTRTLMAKKMPEEHRHQVQGGMWCAGLSGWLFTSYDQRMPTPETQLFIELVTLDPAFVASLQTEVGLFLSEVDRAMQDLLSR